MKFDDRITTKVSGTGHVMLTCRNHQGLAWHTKNISCIGARSIFFAGEGPRGTGTKLSHEGMFPSRQQALKELAAGRLFDRNYPNSEVYMKNTPASVALVNERYDDLETKYVFECPCPMGDLIVDPSYDEMPDVDA